MSNYYFSQKIKKDLISIIIPVYNNPKGIEDTLNSLKKQNLNKEKYEIIVANDGGDKKTARICKKFDVRLVNITPNEGSYAARNKGLSIAKGEYIAFIDADIKATSNWLKKGFELLKKYDYIGGQIKIDQTKTKTLADYFEYLSAFDNKKKLEKYHYIPTANLFIKRKIISALGGFDERLRSGGDFEFGDRVHRSKKFKMHYDKNLIVVHPPRGYRKLVKKFIRTTQGTLDLSRLYPERFGKFSYQPRRFIRALVYPLYAVLTSKKKINYLIRLKLLFWSIRIGTINLFYLIKINRK
jgi:glycosyltransferase AglI